MRPHPSSRAPIRPSTTATSPSTHASNGESARSALRGRCARSLIRRGNQADRRAERYAVPARFGRHPLNAVGAIAALAFATSFSEPASAFCGFYVTGADTSLYSNATMVVLMRQGTQTVISLQNNYEGPPEDFALVLPVPEVITMEQVNTLPHEVFTRVDQLGAPRLVEYWETDPCDSLVRGEAASGNLGAGGTTAVDDANGVTVEAEFAVGEYDVVILSAEQSDGLETWLIDNGYNIPQGAAATLMPYVESGTKFFVAQVDPSRVTFADGQAVLSPLRIAFEAEEFSLPIRIGLLNSKGTQDLIVNILASSRYEAANRPNVLIPTNIRVRNRVRDEFASFYEALFAQARETATNSVVTEYSWSASSCDPCPVDPLDASELASLGADVILGLDPETDTFTAPFIDFTLTRLHYRYTPELAESDLLFREAPPIIGGRGTPNQQGEFETTGDSDFGFNNFQGRYAILHPWTEPITCQQPQRGFWGGPDGMFSASPTQGTTNTALKGQAPVAADLPELLAESVPEIGVEAAAPVDPLREESPFPPRGSGGCAFAPSARNAGGLGAIALSALLGFFTALRSRRHARH